MMPETLSAIVAGHLCLDIFPDFERLGPQNLYPLLKPGKLLQIGAAQFSSGGAVSNTGLALQHLGIPTQLIAKIGDDPFGSILKEIIAQRGPELVKGFITDPQGVTSYSIIISNQVTDRLFLHCTGANDTFGPADIDFRLVKQAALFHFGYPPALRQMYLDGGQQLVQIMRSAKQTQVTTSLDMSLPDSNAESGSVDWRSIYKAVLPYVDIFLPSLEELLFTLRQDLFVQMSSRGEIIDQATPRLLEDLSGELLALGVKIILIKMGSQGIYLRTASEDALKSMGRARPSPEKNWANCERWIPCFKVDVVGTTGAGDTTIAGFLSALLRQGSLDEALTMAVAVGACNVEAADSLGGLRTWEATQDRIKTSWEQLPLQLDAPGWRWDVSSKMWLGPLDLSC
jgi:sugar/nucleoside kinase (ribokinase family)